MASATTPGTSLGAVVSEAYARPFSNLGRLCYVCWPMLVTFIGLTLLIAIAAAAIAVMSPDPTSASPLRNIVALPLILAAFIYVSIMTGSALVAWHRFTVLGPPIGRARFIPDWRDWALTWRWLVIGLLFGLFYIATAMVMALVTGASVGAPPAPTPSDLATASDPETVLRTNAELLRKSFTVPALLIPLIGFALGSLVACLALAKWTTFLPMAAVETKERVEVAARDWRGATDSWYPWALVLSLVPLTVLPTLIMLAIVATGNIDVIAPNVDAFLANVQSGENINLGALYPIGFWLMQILNIVCGLLAPFVFATAISVYYRDRVRPMLEGRDTTPII